MDVEGELSDGDVVLDFIPFKPIVKRCCDELDHKTLLPRDSKWLTIEMGERDVEVHHGEDRFVFPRRDVRILPIPNTSSERLAEFLCGEILKRTAEEIPAARLTRIRVSVQESPGQAGIFEQIL